MERKSLAVSNVSILYLSYDGLTDPLGQSQILPYLSGLARKGYHITIVSFEKKERSGDQQPIRKLCNEHNLEWHPLRYHKQPPVLSTVYDLLILKRKIEKLYSAKKFDIVHCRSYITALAGLWMKKKYDIGFVFDMRGFWADERIEGGLWNIKSFIYRQIYKFFKRKERELIKEADQIVVLTTAAKNELTTWNLNRNIQVIPCCVDLKLFDPSIIRSETQVKLRSDLGINKDDFILMYLGSLGTWYLYDEMILFFSALKAKNSNTRFLFLTPDVQKVKAHPDLIVKTIPRTLVPLYISICHAAVCFIKPSFSKKGSSATKMGEILAMNIPVFANKGWGDIDFIYEKNADLIINLDLPFADQLNLSKYDRSPGLYRSLASQFFSLERGIEAYDSVYRITLNKND